MTMLTRERIILLENTVKNIRLVGGSPDEIMLELLDLAAENERLKEHCEALEFERAQQQADIERYQEDIRELKQYHERFGEIESKKIVALEAKLDKIREWATSGRFNANNQILSILDEDGEQK
jgi:hypothetical protein